ncbi:MAG: GspE/PulE family protein, partial [Anaerolineae bacterium]
MPIDPAEPTEKKAPDQEIEELGRRFGLPVVRDVASYPYVRDKIHKVSYAFAKQHILLPIGEEEGKVIVALTDPFNLEAIDETRRLLDCEIIEVLSPKPSLEEAIERCYHQKENEVSDLIASLKVDGKKNSHEDEAEGYDLLASMSESPVIRMLNVMLSEAIQQGASDIHFEPLEEGLSVRYRIDGVLQQRHAPSKDYQAPLITRIKVMARLDIAEQRLPQDGRIKLKMGGRQIDFRVSTIPVVFGERIVLRILDKSNVLLGLSKLGMPPLLLANFKKLITLSEGIVLVTGPTGSGKTTTLYSAISEINSSEMNIMTIEDPVEYKLQGMAQ